MDYIYAALTGAIETLLIMFYLHKIKWLDYTNIEYCEALGTKSPQKSISLHGNVILFLGIVTVTNFFAILLVKNTTTPLGFIKLIALLGILLTAALIDFKWNIIPNILILTGILVRFAVYILEFILYREIFFVQLKSDILGFAIGFGVFLLVALITHGAVGSGDVKIFGVIGLMSGAQCTYTTLIISLITSAILSIVALITKKKNRKDTIPFGPCILIGYMIAIIVSI